MFWKNDEKIKFENPKKQGGLSVRGGLSVGNATDCKAFPLAFQDESFRGYLTAKRDLLHYCNETLTIISSKKSHRVFR